MGKAGGGVRIRRAMEVDAPSISAIIGRSIDNGDFLLPRTESEIRESIGKGNFFVAVGGGEVIGCASLEEYGGLAELRSLVVDGERTGEGTGKKLIRRVEGLAKRRDYNTLYAFADKGLVGYYEMQGFENRGKFINGGTAPDMNRNISEKMKRYCLSCNRYNVCTEHLMYRELGKGKSK